MNVWALLKVSRKFWLAVVGVVQVILFVLIPDFPEEAWEAIWKLIGILIAAIAAEDIAKKIADGIRYSNGG